MSVNYLKIFERFEKKLEYVMNCMAGFEEYFENFCGKLSSSSIIDRKKIIHLYVVGNNSMQREFENMVYGTIFVPHHHSNLDFKDSIKSVVCENWLIANLDTFLNSSKKRRRRAECIDLKISEYGRELESAILSKLYMFQETLKLQHQFEIITEHTSLQKNAYIKQITILGESNFIMDSEQFVSVVSPMEFSELIGTTFTSKAVLQKPAATNKMMRRKVILVEDDEDNEEQNEISASVVLQYSSDDDDANSIEHGSGDCGARGKIICCLLRFYI
jgi:hypothetical protein